MPTAILKRSSLHREMLPFYVYVGSKYYQRKNVTPVTNVLDDIRHNQTNRGRSTQERAKKRRLNKRVWGTRFRNS